MLWFQLMHLQQSRWGPTDQSRQRSASTQEIQHHHLVDNTVLRTATLAGASIDGNRVVVSNQSGKFILKIVHYIVVGKG